MRLFLLSICLLSTLFAKKDFYYSFIDQSGNQISQRQKQKIVDGFDAILNIREIAKDGKIDEAYGEIKALMALNKINVLKSDIIMLYAELSLKKKTKRHVFDGAKILEKAINSSDIHEDDLSKAYMLLVELKLDSNKIKDAKYFAKIIIDNFDNEKTKSYGKIYLSKVYKHTKQYKKSIRILYEILTQTKDVLVATIVADELFDIYVLSGQKDKAYDLISKVLIKNIDYYSQDSYLAIEKVNKLVRVNMPEFAVEILQELLLRAKKPEVIEDFKYKLANTYMLMYDRTNYYLFKANELYKDILNEFPNGIYTRKSKIFIDEILMREGKISPAIMAKKYEKSESMRQKILLQELLNLKKEEKFEYILRIRKIYRTISDSIAKRFGYETMDVIFDEVHHLMIKQYLEKNRCMSLNKVLQTTRKETLIKLIKNDEIKYKFFECLIEVPYERAFKLVKETFLRSRDANIYLYLERMSHSLGLLDEALDFSAKVDMVNDEKVLSEEFLHRFVIINEKNNDLLLDKFFLYAKYNEQYIKNNENNPVIIDFYYQYFLYLSQRDKTDESLDYLKKLYFKQNEVKAYVYSPFVEMELSRNERKKNNKEEAIRYLKEALKNTSRIKNNDLVQIYYDLMKLYESLKNENQEEEFLLKCKSVKDTKDSFYKKMCDEL